MTEDFKVTQADREAAADLYSDWFCVGEANENIKNIRSGKWDGIIVRAFARHREQADARIVAWLDEQYKSGEGVPTNARHIIHIIRRCIQDGEHLKHDAVAARAT